jgi:hypothetical protein
MGGECGATRGRVLCLWLWPGSVAAFRAQIADERRGCARAWGALITRFWAFVPFTPVSLPFTPASITFARTSLSFTPPTVPFARTCLPFTPASLSFTPQSLPFAQTSLPFTPPTLPFARTSLPFTPVCLSFAETSIVRRGRRCFAWVRQGVSGGQHSLRRGLNLRPRSGEAQSGAQVLNRGGNGFRRRRNVGWRLF